ncbi:DMT family transporter [Sphingomonas lenta]|uniref:EamA family transporter n=1 Tax=Sphingomonas lenta TaxID=1141887 RepID=A0A2A2SJQ9_9SPHN|nr:DMT family transporter [Sphingomonas lenta]PAX09476.1 EamA family transporter [Sphingomonas lenta]
MADTQDRIPAAIGLRLLSVALFGTMNAVIKLAEGAGAELMEILFFRQFGAALLITAVIAAGPGLGSVRTRRMGSHLLRAVVGLAAMACFFTAIMALPLAESTAIGFTIPVFATIIGALVLKEPTGVWRWGAVLAGFLGVLIVTQPGGSSIPLWAAGVALCGCLLTAFVSILLRRMSRTESTGTTVFWFSVLSLPPLGALYLFDVQAHPPLTWAYLFGIGFLGGAAQFAMTGSLRLGPVSVVVPMDYSSLLYATLLGWLLFDALPAPATWVGAPIIIASGLVIVWREQVRRRQETSQAIGDPA